MFAWYTEEQYKRLLLILKDRADFPDSYAVWVETTQNLIEDLAGRDLAVCRVDIDPDELAAWCNLKGFDVNNRSGLAFAAHKAKEMMDAANPRRVNYAPRLEDQLDSETIVSDSEAVN